MATRITIDMFSGRPNPSFVVEGDEERELLGRLAPGRATTARAVRSGSSAPADILGYRGVQVEQLGKARKGTAAALHVFGGRVRAANREYVPADAFVEDFICGSTGPVRLAQLRQEDLRMLRPMVDVARQIDWSDWLRIPGRILRPTCACAPLYEPQWWNDAGQRQYNNNCYNYATNYRTDTFAQPGKASGQMYGALSISEVRSAAVRDDLLYTPAVANKCPKEGHLVALVIAPGYDFHWYRRGRYGRWTHKPGGTKATDRDNSGKLITDPRTADRGPYTQFGGFMTVMHGHVKLK